MPIGITVVIPSFNHGEFIADTLRSVISQKYPAVQVTVQDGGSTPVEDDISGNRWRDESKSSSQHLSQLAEVCATQTRLFGKVSIYYAQNLSDTLFQLIRGNYHGTQHGLFYRTLFFKSVWIWLNLHDQAWLRTGLIDRNVTRSGAIHRDEVDNAAWVREAKQVIDLTMVRKTLKQLYELLPNHGGNIDFESLVSPRRGFRMAMDELPKQAHRGYTRQISFGPSSRFKPHSS
jgi:hypothetical protein